jgi:hypothetical protein
VQYSSSSNRCSSCVGGVDDATAVATAAATAAGSSGSSLARKQHKTAVGAPTRGKRLCRTLYVAYGLTCV